MGGDWKTVVYHGNIIFFIAIGVFLLQLLTYQVSMVFTANWPRKLCLYTWFNTGLSMWRHQSFLTWFLAMIFLRDSLCLSAVSLTRQRHDILDFSYCPLSRVLHVTLTNWQRFGFEFHLRSSPSPFSEYMDISRTAVYFMTCYTVLTRPNKFETAVHGCNSWLSVWTKRKLFSLGLNSIISLPR